MSPVTYPADLPRLVARSIELSQYGDPAHAAHAQFRAARRAVAKAFGLANGWLLAPKDDTDLPRDVREHNEEWRDDVDETFFRCAAVFYSTRDTGRICAAVILTPHQPDDDGLLLEELPDTWVTGLRTFVVRREIAPNDAPNFTGTTPEIF